MPNLENIQIMIDDLLSGNFKQGREFLKRERPGRGPELCCLGLACERFAEKYPKKLDVKTRNHPPYATDYTIADDYYKENFLLPSVVAEWLGIDERGTFDESKIPENDPIRDQLSNAVGFPIALNKFDTLDKLNDVGISFEHIGQFLQRNAQHLFPNRDAEKENANA